MNTTDIKFVEVGPNSDPKHLKGFTQVYQKAFAQPPYNETPGSDEKIHDEVWLPHLKDGHIILAMDGDLVVGLGCGLPMNKWAHDEEFQEFIHEKTDLLPDDIKYIFFMSEIAVLPSYWHCGIGTQLVQSRIELAGLTDKYSHYMMRTASDGSNSINLYLKLGAWVIEGLVQNVTSHADKVGSDSKKRIYMAGKVPTDPRNSYCACHGSCVR